MTLDSFTRIAALGWVTGMRSLTAPALASRSLGHARAFPADLLTTPFAQNGLAVAALGELAADKHPDIPARTTPVPLAGRFGMGALVGAAVAATRGESRLGGALLGGAVAVASSFVMERARREAGDRTGLPDLAVAVGEDALAVGLGSAAVLGLDD